MRGRSFDLPSEVEWTAASGVTDEERSTVAGLLLAVEPLFRALTLAGYRVLEAALGRSTSSSAPSRWLVAAFETGQVHAMTPDDAPMETSAWTPSGAGSMLVLWLDPRVHDESGASMAIELPSVGTSGEGGVPYVGLWHADGGTGELAASLGPHADEAVGSILLDLAARWNDAEELTPDEGSGLLWLFDPEWWADPLCGEVDTTPYDLFGATAADALAAVGTDDLSVEDFLRRQMEGTTVESATLNLAALLEVSPEVGLLFGPSAADAAFAAVVEWAETVGVVQFVPAEDLERLATVSWFEALLMLVDGGLVRSDAILASFNVEEPLWSHEIGANKIELRLFDDPILELERVRQLDNVPDDRWCAWEWVDTIVPPAVIVVAAPGVRVTQLATPRAWQFYLYRAQDWTQIPLPGTAISWEELTATRTFQYEMDPPSSDENWECPAFFTVECNGAQTHLGCWMLTPSGVKLLYQVIVTLEDPTSPDARFIYDLRWAARPPTTLSAEPVIGAVFTIWCTEGVKIEEIFNFMGRPYFEGSFWRFADPSTIPQLHTALAIQIDTMWWGIEGGPEVPDASAADASTLGGIKIGADPSTIDYSDFVTFAWDWITWWIDLTIGFVPVVGNVYAGATLGVSIFTGTDLFGRPITRGQQIALFAGILIPYAAPKFLGAARGGIKYLVYAGRGVDDLITVVAPKLDEAAEAALGTAAKTGVMDDAAREALEKGATTAGKECEGITRDIADIVDGDPKLPTSNFPDPELQRGFKAWKRTNPNGTPEEWAAKATGRNAIKLAAMLGDSYTSVRTAVRAQQISSNWKVLVGFVYRTDGALKAAGLASKGSDIVAAARAVDGRYGDFAELLLKKVSPDGTVAGLTEDAMRKLVGRKSLHPEDVGKLIVMAVDAFDAQAIKMGKTIEDVAAIEGAEGVFQDLLTRGGKDVGSYFEVLVMARRLEAGIPFSKLRGQLRLPSVRFPNLLVKGPDLIEYGSDGLAQLIQCKSYKNLADIMAFNSKTEVARQLLSDLRRLALRNFKVIGEDGKTLVDMDKEIVFYLDETRLLTESGADSATLASFKADPDHYAREFEDAVEVWLNAPEVRSYLGLAADHPGFSLAVELL